MRPLFSQSQSRGLAHIRESDHTIYSVGISTAGSAEVLMAKGHRRRHVTATTVDTDGAEFVDALVRQEGLSDRINVKFEDVSEPLPYPDNTFDFVYARLVLHYLPHDQLTAALASLQRILKPAGRWFFVVRADPGTGTKNPQTGLTSDSKGNTRLFHTPDSILHHVTKAGLSVDSCEVYSEQLCDDFYRQIVSDHVDTVIELTGHNTPFLMTNS